DSVPAEALAASTAPTTVAQRPFVKEWELAELEGLLPQVAQNRNPARGKELFAAVSCVQCHRMKGEGGQVGPDLITVSEKLAAGKMTPKDVLTSMVEPSKVIDDAFRTHVFELEDGQLLSGLIVSQTEKEIQLRSNPLDKKEEKPRVILKASVV